MRKIVIGAAAVATLLAAWFAPDQDGGGVGPAAATTREATPSVPLTDAAPAGAPEELQIHPRVADDDMGNVFAKQSWAPEAPKKMMQEQAPQPQAAAASASGAPALPFQFVGRFTDEGKTAWFLQIDGQNIVARPGEKVNDDYMLDSVNGGTMTFIYLPLHQKQTLVVGDTN
jgi:hypothetical protein